MYINIRIFVIKKVFSLIFRFSVLRGFFEGNTAGNFKLIDKRLLRDIQK